MNHIIEISRHKQKVFSLDEAQELLPIVFRITKSYSLKVQEHIDHLDSMPVASEERAKEIEEQVNDLIQEWQEKLQKLGALPKGLWIADFDSGDGYYCWKFPENGIEFWHKYSDGFSKRVPVAARANGAFTPERIRNKIFRSAPIDLQVSEVNE